MIEGEKSARDIGLRVIVPVHFDLASENQRVASPDHADAGGEVPLGVAIDDETLSLRTRDVGGHILYAGRRRGPHTVRHHAVKRRRPADRCQVKSGILRRAIVAEAADAEVEIADCRGA